MIDQARSRAFRMRAHVSFFPRISAAWKMDGDTVVPVNAALSGMATFPILPSRISLAMLLIVA